MGLSLVNLTSIDFEAGISLQGRPMDLGIGGEDIGIRWITYITGEGRS